MLFISAQKHSISSINKFLQVNPIWHYLKWSCQNNCRKFIELRPVLFLQLFICNYSSVQIINKLMVKKRLNNWLLIVDVYKSCEELNLFLNHLIWRWCVLIVWDDGINIACLHFYIWSILHNILEVWNIHLLIVVLLESLKFKLLNCFYTRNTNCPQTNM